MAIETKIEMVDSCVGCPPEMGCRGTACPSYPHQVVRRVLVCDACGAECDRLARAPYKASAAWYCEDCLDDELEWIGGD